MRLPHLGLVAVLVGTLACTAPAQRVPGYTPSTSIDLRGERRTSAEHNAIYAKRNFPYVVDLRSGKGRLVFLGVTHTNDPQDPQFVQLRTRWDEVRPTVALVEGRPTLHRGRLEDAAKKGEPAYVTALAARDGCRVLSLEPPMLSHGAALAAFENPDRVLTFLVLNGFVSDRRIEGKAPTDVMVNFMLLRRAKDYGLTTSIRSTDDLDALWGKDFPMSPNWRQVKEEALWPSPGGTYLNRLARESNIVRDNHWARSMVDLVRSGETVFAVGGASHAIILEPVLRETLELPQRSW